MRTTHTYALLEVSAAVYDEIEAKLRDAGYDHAFYEDSIQMQGIALKRALPEVARREDGAYTVGPPPDGKTVEEHCDELVKVGRRKVLPLCPRCKLFHTAGGLCSADHEAHCAIRTSRDGWDADCSCSRGHP